MIVIKVVTRARGFLIDLFTNKFSSFEFEYHLQMLYETNSKFKKIVTRNIKKPFFSYFGVFQIKRVNIKEDIAFSFNRFLKSNKPYILYLESPLAPVHYCIGRTKTFVSRLRLKKVLNDDNLKAIICLSNACEKTLEQYYDVPNRIIKKCIYPLVTTKYKVTKQLIREKSQKSLLKCLYISSSFELKGGQDILSAFSRLEHENIHLVIISKKNSISRDDMQYILENKNRITLYDFNLDKKSLGALYLSSNILLNPTRQDSFPLVVLEAMKYGNTILTTNEYAIPEMVEEGKEGFLIESRYKFWKETLMPNEEVWNNREKTIYSRYVDEKVVKFLVEKLALFCHDRELLYKMSLNAFKKANNEDFSEKCISKKWESVFEIIVNESS